MSDEGNTTGGDDWFAEGTATFGDRLSAAREAAGLSPAQLARRLGVKARTLAGWEQDLAEPRANKLQMLAGLLNVSMVWLLTGQGDGPSAPDEDVAPSPDLGAVMLEIREMRLRLARDAEHLGRLEKALRRATRDAGSIPEGEGRA